jgi:hypothetical protein
MFRLKVGMLSKNQRFWYQSLGSGRFIRSPKLKYLFQLLQKTRHLQRRVFCFANRFLILTLRLNSIERFLIGANERGLTIRPKIIAVSAEATITL